MAADDGPFGVAKIGQFEYSVGVGHSPRSASFGRPEQHSGVLQRLAVEANGSDDGSQVGAIVLDAPAGDDRNQAGRHQVLAV